MTTPAYFSLAFIEGLMQQHAPLKQICLKKVQPFDVDNSASILAVLTAGRTANMIGHFGLAVSYEQDGVLLHRNMVLKIKPHGKEIVEMLNSLAAACGSPLAEIYPSYKHLTGFQHTHHREQIIYKQLAPPLTPEIFGLMNDDKNESYVILMEYLQDVTLLNSVMTPELWTDVHIKIALEQMAQWHATILNEKAEFDAAVWDDAPSLSYMQMMTPLWNALLQNAATKFPNLYTKRRVTFLQRAIDQIPTNWQHLETLPKTLVHNDLNPRNTCFKERNGKAQFCVYDWELSTFHIPQYDVAEFLCFVLDKDRYDSRFKYLDYYRTCLHRLTGDYADAGAFKKDFCLAALDFGIHRIGMYMMAHSVSPYPFLPKVVDSFFDTVMNA